MEQAQCLIDTNAIIDFLGKKMPPKGMAFMNGLVNAVPNVSVISKIELLGFDVPKKHAQLLVAFMNDATVLDLTNNVIEATIEIRKKHRTKLPDAIIAATAIVYDLTLVTRNASDFRNISNLRVLDPHSL